MRKILQVFVLLFLCTSPAFAWNMKIKIGAISYEAKSDGGEIRYMSGGKIVGTATRLGDKTIFRNSSGQEVGSLAPLGETWYFKDARGQEIGSAVRLGNDIVYRDARGVMNAGSSSVSGWSTTYRDGQGAVIGEADTTDMPLRPVPLEAWLIEQSIPSVCLTLITNVIMDKPAAAAGLRAGDLLIGWEGRDWTVFDVQSANPKNMLSKVAEELRKMRDIQDQVMIVYRPAQGENGMAKGTIMKLRPMPAGSKGYFYSILENGPTFIRRNSINYSEQIKKLYLSGAFENAPAFAAPDPASYKKDPRDVPGAHQELRDCIMNDGSSRIGWYWVRDKDGATMSGREISAALEKAAMEKQPRVTITSYPGAKIFLSTVTAQGNGDPNLNSSYKFIGQADENGVFRWSGSEIYVLPLGSKGLAFYASVSNVSMEAINNHPMITSLPPNTNPAVRSAMINQVRTMLTAMSGGKPEIKFGYVPIEEGKDQYTLK